MPRPILRQNQPFAPEKQQEIISAFHRDGFAKVGRIFNARERELLRNGVDRVLDQPRFAARDNVYAPFIAVRLFETSRIFEELLTHEPLISLMEELLGPECHLIAQNAIRNAPGQAIDTFHVDDSVLFPLPPEVPRHPANVPMPVFICCIQIALTDIRKIEYGPTEFVPGSHYSGRQPNDPKTPTFEGRKPKTMLCRAGDVYLANGQCWHRGAPNNSDQTRYLLGCAYAQRFVAQRFYPFANYHMPKELLDKSDPRQQRVLGVHPHGAYG